ncbi:hypothetical protein BOW53_07125 [Solemya pervernicosa gill symbiont]|uniref:Uncharacterized protein n=2 Tax=Gammaproteobacteria incertae sedis TaxID=118884 RepID=A0A1T2L690_9GAMM|nr:hypothetical protein [Candidatus Reidiella endopervernicosa]OOZ40617.1 hypothetical protein BOW53_07125 [Solemya pervernicosa gill symbiont]QKQ26639.1 hypothetical protein HUE57_10375 [Candidatus Reidiella endopervernicosa]
MGIEIIQGLNEERMGRIRTLEGELVANSAAIAGASESIMQLRRSIEKANELLANIRTEKAKLEANASECQLERRRACWNAYDAALAEANKQLEAAIKKLDDAENAKNKEVEDAAKAAQTLRDRLKATYEEINNLEQQHGDKLDDYRRAKLELEAAEEYYDRAQQEASDFSRANNITGYTQTYSNLIADFHADRAKWLREVKRLEGEVKPIEDRLDALRKQADEDWPNLAKANDKHEQLEGELDQLREGNKPKREEAAKARDQAANQAQTELDACLKRVSDAASSDATLLFTMARNPNLDRCGKLLAEAEAGYEAVKRNNVKKFIEVPCPKKPKIAIGSPPICPDPAANRAISVGPNSEVGSGARLTEKATGMLGGALGGLLGGGGGGFGMGPSSMMGGGDEPAQPDTVDDPVSKKLKKKFTHKPSGTKLRVGGKFNDKGLLISTTILDTPGDGTFQTAYLEDPRGHRGGPVGYWIYDVYQEWNLTVSWTHDRWVDGEHVLHEEGGWQESGTNLLDTFRVPVYEEPIWARLGFGSAIKGISSLGTQYLITKEQLKKEPVYLVTHITQPNADPVTTVPMILKLSLNAKGKLDMSQVSATKADIDCKGKKRTKVKQPEPKKSKSKPKAKEPTRDPEPSPLDNEFFMGS